jgi:transcriptional regulator with XRE-family HTH domain
MEVAISCNSPRLLGLSVQNLRTVVSDGKVLALRRERLGWKQEALAARAGVSLSTVVRAEKDRNVRRDMWLAVESALAAEESSRGLGALQLVTRSDQRHQTSPLTSSVHGASTNRENIPKGSGEDDPASTRIRELEDRLERQGEQIQELRDMLKRLARIATKRAESGPARKNQTGRGGPDR